MIHKKNFDLFNETFRIDLVEAVYYLKLFQGGISVAI